MSDREFLNIKYGQPYEMRIMENKITPRTYHWYAGVSVDCEGDGCPYCKTKYDKRSEGWLDVDIDGVLLRWSFPASVGVKIKDVVPILQNARIYVKCILEHGRQLWDIRNLDADPGTDPTKASAITTPYTLRMMADTQRTLATALDKIADTIEGKE